MALTCAWCLELSLKCRHRGDFLNADDRKRRGERPDWIEHFHSKNIVNLRYGGHDTTQVEPGSDLFQTKKQKFLHMWKAMMANLDDLLASKTGKVTILYLCFGGVLPLCVAQS